MVLRAHLAHPPPSNIPRVRDFPCDPCARNAEYKWDMDILGARRRPAVNYTQARGLAVGKRREPAAAMPVA
ncbi:Uncharacterized protein DBV15_01234 [Temnothorax longispinosus]|uniref:Uncharacterized protein n=1 Tax=Temnothorax longispinosus TaxID=300112 RepID=A0A4S2KKJ0_9HYME|nr:Uncharacterized protein DBV15_01234 [Temnothorax longispinosus]